MTSQSPVFLNCVHSLPLQASSAGEVVAACDITFSCVSDPAALREVIFGNSGALQGIADGKGWFIALSFHLLVIPFVKFSSFV